MKAQILLLMASTPAGPITLDDFGFLVGQRIRRSPQVWNWPPGSARSRQLLIYYSGTGGNAETLVSDYSDSPTRAARADRIPHLLIDEQGWVTQFASCATVVPHSANDLLNQTSIGLELVNSGPLRTGSQGRLIDAYGRVIARKRVFWDRLGNPWERFTSLQIAISFQVIVALVSRYRVTPKTWFEAQKGQKNGTVLDSPAFPFDNLLQLLQNYQD